MIEAVASEESWLSEYGLLTADVELPPLFGPAATLTLPVVNTKPETNGKLVKPFLLNVPICG